MDARTLLVRLRGAVGRLGCSPAELAALAVLVTGALALLAMLWLRTPPAPEPLAVVEAGAAQTDGSVVGEDAASGPAGAAFVTSSPIVVHVAGAVVAPGLYELPAGARVADAVDAAGGATADAVLDQINLAREARDGEQVVVPDAAMAESAASGGVGARGPSGRVNLNRAGVDELQTLPGIGPVTAQRIVEYREQHGPFAEAGDLLHVPGIGPRTLEDVADHVET